MSIQLKIIIEKDANRFSAWCPELAEFKSQRKSLEAVMADVQRAMALYWGNLVTEESDVVVDHGGESETVKAPDE